MNIHPMQAWPESPADAPGKAPDVRPPLVALGAQRWNFDWQRPQQMLTRLAMHYRIFYVEPPLATHRDSYLACTEAAPGVEVLVPHTRCDTLDFHDDPFPSVAWLLGQFLRERAITEPLAWIDTPAALPLLEALGPRGVVYDCDAAMVASGDAELQRREARLLRRADVVIAGGPSLLRSLRARHPRAHCVSNAVDAAHFAPPPRASQSIEAVSARAIHAAIPNPRLGFFGVIDERVDLELVARLADLRPDWQIIMAGPLRGVATPALPRRGNLLWLGAQTYAILPHLQAHWDVCLLPFKVDACAHRAAPIEVLEFLAGQKPVVSTPVHDVVALQGHVVRVADGASAFVDACRTAMCERGPLRRQRRIDALLAVHSCTWDRAADRVHKLLAQFAFDPAGLPSARLAGARQASQPPSVFAPG